MADDPETKNELSEAKEDLRDAKEDLRETLLEINHQVEKRVAGLSPERPIRKHPLRSACVAGALGFAIGSDSREAAMIGMLLLGAALILTRNETVQSDGTEPV
jgi:hypothetical protein